MKVLSAGVLGVAICAVNMHGVARAGDADIVLTPDKVQLNDVASYPGMKAATLMGNFSKPGTFVIRMKFPANYVLGPHTHPDDRTITVLEGTWYSGNSDVADCAKAAAMPAGSFGFIAGNAVHFDCTGPDGAYIQVTGSGPSGTKWLNPADDPKIKYAK